jgi:Rrf2 family transcriptional regulator, nitric oxide-sensitive transcriptional repressor
MFSQTAEYALRALVFLASEPESCFSTSQISGKTEIPLYYLRKIMNKLAKTDLLKSRRGNQGCFVLMKNPSEISILEIINIIDPINIIDQCPLANNAHCKNKGPSCHTTLCPLHKMMKNVALTFQDEISNIFLTDLVFTLAESKATDTGSVTNTIINLKKKQKKEVSYV